MVKTVRLNDSCWEKLAEKCPKSKTYSDFIEEMVGALE